LLDAELVPPEDATLAFSPLALGVVAALALAGALLLLAVPTEASTFSLSFTLRTPGIAFAISTARLRSSSEATLPFSFTSPLSLTSAVTFENAGSEESWLLTFVCSASSCALVCFSFCMSALRCASAVAGSLEGMVEGLLGSPPRCEASGTVDAGGVGLCGYVWETA